MDINDIRTLYRKGFRKPRHIESCIQQDCVSWFRWQYSNYIIFAVPNGGSRNALESANMKKEGVMPGVSDLIVIANGKILFVEMKAGKNTQQQSQKDFQHKVEDLGFKYILCRSLEEFISAIEEWLNG